MPSKSRWGARDSAAREHEYLMVEEEQFCVFVSVWRCGAVWRMWRVGPTQGRGSKPRRKRELVNGLNRKPAHAVPNWKNEQNQPQTRPHRGRIGANWQSPASTRKTGRPSWSARFRVRKAHERPAGHRGVARLRVEGPRRKRALREMPAAFQAEQQRKPRSSFFLPGLRWVWNSINQQTRV